MLRYLLLSVFLLNITLTANAVGIIYGKILYSDGKPAADVVVNLNNTNIYGISDETGFYQLENVPFGKHSMIVKPFGSEIRVLNVELKTEKLKFGIELSASGNGKQLKELNVRARSKSQMLKNSGYSVGIVETQQMALQSVQTTELLDRTAGVRIRQDGGMGSGMSFNINGLSGNSVRILSTEFRCVIMARHFQSAVWRLNRLSESKCTKVWCRQICRKMHWAELSILYSKKISNRKMPLWLLILLVPSIHIRPILMRIIAMKKPALQQLPPHFTTIATTSIRFGAIQVFVSEPSYLGLQYVKARRFHDSYQSYGLNADVGFTNVKWADRFLIGALYSDMDKDVQHGGTMEVVYGNRRTGQNTKMLNMRYDKRDIVKGLDVNSFVSFTEGQRWVVDTIPHIYNWLGNRLWNDRTSDYFSWNVGGGEAGKATLANNVERTIAGRANASYEFVKGHRLNANYLYNRFTRDVIDPLLPAAEQDLTETRFLTKQIIGLSYDASFFKSKLKTSVFGKYYFQNVSLKNPVKVNNQLTQENVDKTVDNKGFGAAVSYSLHSKIVVQTSYEKAIRLPESSELLGNTSDNVEAAYNLRPETANNFNLGFNFGPFEKNHHIFRSDINFFFRDIRDMIMRGAETTNTGNYSFEKSRANPESWFRCGNELRLP